MRQAVHAIGIAAELGDGLGLRIEAKNQPFVDDAEQHAALMPQHSAGWALVGTGDPLELP